MGTPKIALPMDQIAAFCRKWKIAELSPFGSVLRWVALASLLFIVGCAEREGPQPGGAETPQVSHPKSSIPVPRAAPGTHVIPKLPIPVPQAAPGAHFLGLADDEERKIEEGPLRGITTMTKVQPSDYKTYLDLKSEGQIKAEERRGSFIYYAVPQGRDVRFPNPSPGGPISAWVTITERFRAEAPKE